MALDSRLTKDQTTKKASGKPETRASDQKVFRGKTFFRRSRVCPFAGSDDPIDYKDFKLLRRFLTDRGKIMPRRLTYVTAKRQRELVSAIKRARFLGLLPYIID